MAPTDPRHGTYAGSMAHLTSETEVCPACRAARLRYNKGLRLDHERGIRRTMSILGSRRRLQALNALGYSQRDLAAELGVTRQRVYQWTSSAQYERIYPATALQISELYERLCMTPKVGRDADRVRSIAAEKGCAPPLAWDDIDNDPAPAAPRKANPAIDPVVVRRVLDGDPTPARAATLAERREITRRWLDAGRSQRQLGELTGWKVERYLPQTPAAAASTPAAAGPDLDHQEAA